MIAIKIRGSISNKELRKELRKISRFYLKQLLPKKRNINIEINLIKDLSKKEKAYGDCYRDEHNSYIIRIDSSQSKEQLLKVLAHEFVHLKQYDRRELIFLRDEVSAIWKGKTYINYDYAKSPWEIEANIKEIELYNNYIKICQI